MPRKQRVTSVSLAIQLTLTPSPFVQRVWVALEAKGLQYQYIEVDPYKKPQALLDVNPRGLVPGLRHGDWGCGESTVLMEYVRTILFLFVRV
jgi:glutathione S-transferase